MARTSTYLNFTHQTEEAFNFYRIVFGGEFLGPLQRMSQAPAHPGAPPMSDAVGNLVLHVELAITGGHVLMGTDAPQAMGFPPIAHGNGVHINVEPDTLDEATRLFDALAHGGAITMPLQPMFWGATFGSLKDKFGVQWMVNYANK